VAVTDASLNGGAAAYAGDFIYTNWICDNPDLCGQSINVLELFAILMALRRWGLSWQRSYLCIYTDSNVALYSITKGRMDSLIGMNIIREIHLILATNNITLILKRITTKNNSFADALSRFDDVKFARYALSMLMDPGLHSCRVLCNPLHHMSLSSWHYLLQQWHDRRPC
jgi:hypothetical protein